MNMHTLFSNEQVKQLLQRISAELNEQEQLNLASLLDAVVIKTIARDIPTSARTAALPLFRADPVRLVQWLDEQYPSLRLTIVEALTRTLLSLTVE